MRQLPQEGKPREKVYTVRQHSIYSPAEACKLARQDCCLEGVPDLRRGLLCNNGGLNDNTGAMDWRFAVYLQLSVEYGQAS